MSPILMGTKYGDDRLLSNQMPEAKPKVQNKMLQTRTGVETENIGVFCVCVC